jgi:hypothetical protein
VKAPRYLAEIDTYDGVVHAGFFARETRGVVFVASALDTPNGRAAIEMLLKRMTPQTRKLPAGASEIEAALGVTDLATFRQRRATKGGAP